MMEAQAEETAMGEAEDRPGKAGFLRPVRGQQTQKTPVTICVGTIITANFSVRPRLFQNLWPENRFTKFRIPLKATISPMELTTERLMRIVRTSG